MLKNIESGLIIIIATLGSVIVGLFLKADYKKQFDTVKGTEFRKKYGGFPVARFMDSEKLIKNKEWLKQRNWGVGPDSLKRKISYTDHFEKCEGLVSKKGL